MSCCNLRCINNINSSYIKWIIEILGPVLLGSKASEIINIPFYDSNKDEKINEINKHFENCSVVKHIIIDKGNNGVKVLFINKDALNKRLQCVKSQNFLKYLGYPREICVNSYLNHLIEKLKGDTFPDEIGIFLGYPLKDVVGFMGYGNYELHTTKYWKVYGDPKPSQELYEKFLSHREKMRNLLNTKKIESILALF
jgi:hypothetical protein